MLQSCIVCSTYVKADRFPAYTILWVAGVEGVYNKHLLCGCHRIKEMCCGLSECCTALPVEFCLFHSTCESIHITSSTSNLDHNGVFQYGERSAARNQIQQININLG